MVIGTLACDGLVIITRLVIIQWSWQSNFFCRTFS